jgi:hypothetical protein
MGSVVIVTSKELERWKAEEDAWSQRNAEVIADTFQDFMEHGEWPEVRKLQRRYVQAGRNLDVQQIVDSKPRVPGQLTSAYEQHLSLGARHLLGCREAVGFLNFIVNTTQHAVDVYRSPESEDLVVMSTDPEIAAQAFTDQALQRLPQFVLGDPPNAFAGDSWGGEQAPTFALEGNHAFVVMPVRRVLVGRSVRIHQTGWSLFRSATSDPSRRQHHEAGTHHRTDRRGNSGISDRHRRHLGP